MNVELTTAELSAILQALAIKKEGLENPQSNFSQKFREEHLQSTNAIFDRLMPLLAEQPDAGVVIIKMLMEISEGM